MQNQGELNLTNNWVWLVIRRDGNTDPADWHLQGIAADEAIANQMCIDEDYIIGPIPINMVLPHNKIEWAGSYFPLRV